MDKKESLIRVSISIFLLIMWLLAYHKTLPYKSHLEVGVFFGWLWALYYIVITPLEISKKNKKEDKEK